MLAVVDATCAERADLRSDTRHKADNLVGTIEPVSG